MNQNVTKQMISQNRKMAKEIRAKRKQRQQQKNAMKKVFKELKKAVRSRATRLKAMKKVFKELKKAVRSRATRLRNTRVVQKQYNIVRKQLVNKFKPLFKIRNKFYLEENDIYTHMIIRIHADRKEHVKLFRAIKEHLKETKSKKRIAKKVAKEAKKAVKTKKAA